MIIYLVKNKLNGKVYVGKTVRSLECRWKDHCAAARHPRSSIHLSCAIHKYSPKAFRVRQIATAESETELNQLERHYISKYKSHLPKFGYNQTLGGDGFSLGNKHRVGCKLSAEHKARVAITSSYPRSPETRAKMRAAQQNRAPISEETRMKMRLAKLGKLHGPMPEAQKVKMHFANLGKKRSKETREALRASHLGKTIPEEQRKRISETLKGRPRPAEVREKIRRALVGKSFTESHRLSISHGKTGVKLAPAHCRKIGDGVRANLATLTPEQMQERMRPVLAILRKKWNLSRMAKRGKV